MPCSLAECDDHFKSDFTIVSISPLRSHSEPSTVVVLLLSIIIRIVLDRANP